MDGEGSLNPRTVRSRGRAVIRRRLVIVLLCALVVPAAVFAYSSSQDEQYSASGALLFKDPGLDQTFFGSGSGVPPDPDREAATNVALVSLDNVAERTATELGGGLTGTAVSDKVEVSTKGQADLAYVKATDADPQRAALIANTFAQQFIAFRRESDQAKIRQLLAVVEEDLERLPPSQRRSSAGATLSRQANQLRLLASIQTGNAELVERAEVPQTPSSPKPMRDAVLGLILGTVLGVGLAFFFERLDKRLRDPKDVESVYSWPVLGAIPHSKALRKPATDTTQLPEAEEEAFRMLRANIRYFDIDQNLQAVLVTSAAPAEGKSTVAWYLAAATASAGARVLLVEADLRRPSLAGRYGLKSVPGLSEIFTGEEDLTSAVQEVAVEDRTNGAEGPRIMDVLVAGAKPPKPAELWSSDSERMHELIRAAKETYDLVVFDTSPTVEISDAIPLIKDVDGVVVVTRLGTSPRDAASRLRDQFDRLEAPMLGVVINGAGREDFYS